MKPRKLKKLLQGLAFGVCITPSVMSYAAQEYTLWGKVDNYAALLKEFSLNPVSPAPRGLQLPVNLKAGLNTAQNLQFISGVLDQSKVSHSRYNQYYHGLPVWGPQLIYHVSSNKTSVTGSLLKGIEQDIKDLNGKISLEEAKNIAFGKNIVRHSNVEKIIYFNKDVSTKALLAYHVTYSTRTSDGPAILSYMIDANSGKILQQWDALTTDQKKVGQGSGGTDLDKGQYKYQFGKSTPGLNALQKIDVLVQGGVCLISNPSFRVLNLKNVPETSLPFGLPVSSADETKNQLQPFVYYCSAPNYLNSNDNGYAPINHGASPINDTAYFARLSFNMLKQQYQVPRPIGVDLPLRIYTHLGNYDNAFACGTKCMRGMGIVGPQQLVFGNGQSMFAPLTQGDVVAHEFGHLVTDQYSNLIYANQSGGMNEAFSDMTGMTLDDYVRTKFPGGSSWYPNGKDWNLGAATSLNNSPLRYISDPTKDGRSIDHASNYRTGMDPHLSSGVYNKAFYLLSVTPGWTIKQAYQVMLDANMSYWTTNATYNNGACGVLQAAMIRGYNTASVTAAFRTVGVTCSVSEEAMMEV